MVNKEVKINELVIKLPAGYKDQAQNIGKEVMQQVVEGLSPNMQKRKLDSLTLKVNVPEGTPQSKMMTQISEAITNRLR